MYAHIEQHTLNMQKGQSEQHGDVIVFLPGEEEM